MLTEYLYEEIDYLNAILNGETETIEANQCHLGHWLASLPTPYPDLQDAHARLHEIVELAVRLQKVGELQAAREEFSFAFLAYGQLSALVMEVDTDL